MNIADWLMITTVVETLNRIDLEFSTTNRKEKEVIEAWKAYLDLLGDKNIPQDQWGTRRVDCLQGFCTKWPKSLLMRFTRHTSRIHHITREAMASLKLIKHVQLYKKLCPN